MSAHEDQLAEIQRVIDSLPRRNLVAVRVDLHPDDLAVVRSEVPAADPQVLHIASSLVSGLPLFEADDVPRGRARVHRSDGSIAWLDLRGEALPPDLQGMIGLLVELRPAFTFTMGHEHGIGWESESVEVSALPPNPDEPPDCSVLSVWRLSGHWRFCLRPGKHGEVKRGALLDQAKLRALLDALDREVPAWPSR